MKISEILTKYKLLDSLTDQMVWHLNIGRLPIERIARFCGITEEMSEKEIAQQLADSINKCYSSHPNYDDQLYCKLSSIGNNTKDFRVGHNHNKWNNGFFEDDGFGMGSEITSIYEDAMDRICELEDMQGPKM